MDCSDAMDIKSVPWNVIMCSKWWGTEIKTCSKFLFFSMVKHSRTFWPMKVRTLYCLEMLLSNHWLTHSIPLKCCYPITDWHTVLPWNVVIQSLIDTLYSLEMLLSNHLLTHCIPLKCCYPITDWHTVFPWNVVIQSLIDTPYSLEMLLSNHWSTHRIPLKCCYPSLIDTLYCLEMLLSNHWLTHCHQ
jgi:hypothetical protein